ncbi:flagellar biosynthetic protein FliR [Desulfovibrio sp. OttesenSCG-928-I05]|nr:flagellar biosynthetic protein FliR [Desulfovibrio sp. OttesenSCG-928-I05]
MEQIFAMDPALFMSFLLTLFRVSLILFLLPFYGGEYIPVQVKGALCLVLTFALWPHLSFDGSYFPAHPFGIALLLLSELLVGLMMGLSVHFVFAGIQTGGQMLGFQMGFTMVQVADPAGGGQISITSHLLYMVTLMIFLVLDGHLVLLRALTATFKLIPPGEFFFRPPVLMDILRLSGGMFILAVKVVAPVLAALFLIELALALMARAAPQMNLIMLGMPLKIAVGFFFMGLIFTILGKHIEEFIIEMGPMFTNLLRLGSPGLQ